MWFFKRRAEEISRTEPGFEEGERRTSWTGVILLIIMAIAGLSFGWRAVDDLARVPTEPPPLSYCADRYIDQHNYVRSVGVSSPLRPTIEYDGFLKPNPFVGEPPCQFNDLEEAAGIPAHEAERRPLVKSLRDLTGRGEADLERARARREQVESQYNIRLQEQQAGVPSAITPTLTELQAELAAAGQDEERLRQTVEAKRAEGKTFEDQIKMIDAGLRQAYQPVFAEQTKRLRWYEFKVFLLQLLFVLPLFLLALRTYLRQLKKNSPYAIIFTAVVAVMGILLLRVILAWFWDLFLARLIEVLWQWIKNVEILRSIVFYLGMVLSFAIFGGSVYYLQKRIFDPRRLAIRRFRAKQCPQCQTNLDLSVSYCPQCGHHLRATCPQCGQPRFVELPHCPHCGSRTP